MQHCHAAGPDAKQTSKASHIVDEDDDTDVEYVNDADSLPELLSEEEEVGTLPGRPLPLQQSFYTYQALL